MKDLEDNLFPILDKLFCERITQFKGEYRWGHSIGFISTYVKYKFGDDFVTGYFNDNDEEGMTFSGQLDLIEYIWWCGRDSGWIDGNSHALLKFVEKAEVRN
jgi:hypothetical protein